MTEETNPNQASGVRHIAEKAVPRPARRKPAPVKAPARKPSVTPKPAAPKPAPRAAVKAVQELSAKHSIPVTGKPPRQVPNFVLKQSDRGTRIVHTFKGNGIWEVWQEAYESREEIYDDALKHAVPTEGYWMEDGLIADQLGDFLYDGTPLPWKWYATLEETETPHVFYN